MFLLALLVGVVAIVGCGGAGQGISSPSALATGGVSPAAVALGGVSPAAFDPAVAGTWSLVHKTQDALDVYCGSQWPAGTVRQVCVFTTTGTTGAAIETYYNASLARVGPPNTGTWSSSKAVSGLQTLTVSFMTPTKYAYQVDGNVLTLVYTVGVHHYIQQWAKEPTLPAIQYTEHDANLEKTWSAYRVLVSGGGLEGASEPISYLTGSTTYSSFARSFLPNGSSQAFNLKVGTIQLPQLPPHSWATGGGNVVKYGAGPYQSAIYMVWGNYMDLWYLNGNGCTIVVQFTAFGAAGVPAGALHDPLLAGTWDMKSAIATLPGGGTTDVLSLLLSQLDPTATSGKAIFWSDGTGEGQVLSGTTLKYAALSTWYTTSSPAKLHSGTFGLATETYAFTDPAHPTHPMSMTWSVKYVYSGFTVPVTIVLNRE
jgi:hypothetical protein